MCSDTRFPRSRRVGLKWGPPVAGRMVVPDQAGAHDPVGLEAERLARWESDNTFERSIDIRRGGQPFTFLEGPPTANGKPGIHHVIARTYKDLVCRWKAMQGHLVERKAGWDTHGLPVEIEVQKQLDLGTNQEIEAFGMAEFNEACRTSVWTYLAEWRETTERMGFWLDLDQPYATLDQPYVESAWWSLKQMWDKGLLFQDHKVLPYCPQTGTSYSSHEVALGYKEVTEPSVHVTFKLVDDGAVVLAWTTTPWTLPGNVGLAVGPDVTYARVRVSAPPGNWEGPGGAEIGTELILAEDLLKTVLRHRVEVIETFPGRDLVGRAYEPLFPGAIERGDSTTAWTVIEADFVTTTDGTGVVHTAVMYGEDDFKLGRAVGLPEVHTVGMDGAFVAGVHPRLDGRYVKDCDADIIALLDAAGRLYRSEDYTHDYPHCWRTGHPLLYYAMDSWFVRMSQLRERLLELNDQVEWAPGWVGQKRFGEWLSNVKDWAISRERFWGTPLPIWASEDGSEVVCIGSIDELREVVETARAAGVDQPSVGDDIDLHRPWVDQWVLVGESGARLERVPFVMDCWFDSGCAFFAQWHYPFENSDTFQHSFPVDYICEGMDQTRGWFYTLLAVSTAVFDEMAYRRCLSVGLILDKDGRKMSKSKGNVVDPWDHFKREGADAVRWYMVASGAPWNAMKFDPAGVRETSARVMSTLWNVYRFHADYAALDGFDAGGLYVPLEDRAELDRWVMSRLSATVSETTALFNRWEFHKAARVIEAFLVDDLSNWHVRRSRRRVWEEADSMDKASCQHTLHEALITVCRLMAPVAPFMPDRIHEVLTGESVHLSDWPLADQVAARDEDLETRMDVARQLVEAGRRIRIEVDRRSRLPCAAGWVVGASEVGDLLPMVAHELNVEQLSLEADLERFQRITIVPNKRALGAKARQDLPRVVAALEAMDPEAAWTGIQDSALVLEGVMIGPEDVEVRRVEREGCAAATLEGGDVTLVLDLSTTPELRSKGLARDLTRQVQNQRKTMDLDVMAEVGMEVWFEAGEGIAVPDRGYVEREARASSAAYTDGAAPDGDDVVRFEVDGSTVAFRLAA